MQKISRYEARRVLHEEMEKARGIAMAVGERVAEVMAAECDRLGLTVFWKRPDRRQMWPSHDFFWNLGESFLACHLHPMSSTLCPEGGTLAETPALHLALRRYTLEDARREAFDSLACCPGPIAVRQPPIWTEVVALGTEDDAIGAARWLVAEIASLVTGLPASRAEGIPTMHLVMHSISSPTGEFGEPDFLWFAKETARMRDARGRARELGIAAGVMNMSELRLRRIAEFAFGGVLEEERASWNELPVDGPVVP